MKIIKLACLVFISVLFQHSIVSQNLYDINNITIIELSFEETNWDEILDQYYANGNGERLTATVEINGVHFDSVGVRYKGSASYSPNFLKNPFNIKLNYVIDQDYEGFEKLKLANGNHDISFIREVLSYEIARKYMVAPLSNYAKVYVNGNYHGLYCSSESINGDFGERYLYADGDNTRFKCGSDMFGQAAGVSSLNYLGTDSTIYYYDYELKSDYGWLDLIELTDVLNNQSVDIENLLNIDRVIWMHAFNNVLVSVDSYLDSYRNYYLFKDDNGIFDVIIWDLKRSLCGLANSPNLNPFLQQGNPEYPLINLILEDDFYKKMYIAHCRTILEENFANGWYSTRGYELQSLITDAYQTDPNPVYDFTWFVENMAFITDVFETRVNYLQNHVAYQHTPPTISDIEIIPEIIPEFSTITITALVVNTNNVQLRYRHSLSDEFTKTTMYDDGNHNDGAAGDGVYGVEISVGSTDIQYYIYAENNNAGMFAPERAEHEFFEIEVINSASDVVINEFMADNSTTITDPDGEYDDWIELYNNTDFSFGLEGYYMTDDADELSKWQFPDVSIEANGYLIVWADEDEEQEGLHANFKLSANGEELYLTAPDGVSIFDQITFGAQTTDITTGRYPNGTGDFVVMLPTFNAENGNAVGIQNIVVSDPEVKIYPNPASDWLKIEINDEKSYQFEIYNFFGSLIYEGIFVKEAKLAVSEWPSGLYVLKIAGKGYRIVVFKN